MPQITNKIKLSGLFAIVLVGSLMFTSCTTEKKTEETETAAPTDTVKKAEEMRTAPDSLPPLDSSAKKRPEPRTT
jgi:hypothetical protein